MSKVLKFAGVSRVAGVLKFRTAADEKRIAQLIKLGDTDIEISAINSVTSKSMAAKELLGMNFMADNAEVQALLVSVANDDNTVKAPKAKKEVTVKVKAPKAKKVKAPEPRVLSDKEMSDAEWVAEAKRIQFAWVNKALAQKA